MTELFRGPLPTCCCVIVPQNNEYMVQSFGKWEKTLSSGCYFIKPCVEEISARRNMREGQAAVGRQQTFTKDNVVVFIEGTLFMKITDSHKSCYAIDQPLQSLTIAAQALVRAQVGSMILDELIHNRAQVNAAICAGLAKFEADWGIKVTRYEVQDISFTPETQNSMQLQSSAERLRRAQVIASEGERAAAVNRSEAQRCQFINNSEGERQATVNFAEGKAQQIVLEAQGRAQVVNMAATAQKTALEMFVSAGLSPAEASRLSVALRYVDMLPAVLANTQKSIVSAGVSDGNHSIVNASVALQYGSLGTTQRQA